MNATLWIVLVIVLAYVLSDSKRSLGNSALILTLVTMLSPIISFLSSGFGSAIFQSAVQLGTAFLLRYVACYLYLYLLEATKGKKVAFFIILIVIPLVLGQYLGV